MEYIEEKIYISIEEYKELLMIKGRYEELKSMYYGPYSNTKISYRNFYEPTEYEEHTPKDLGV